jgi:hypothetical protein
MDHFSRAGFPSYYLLGILLGSILGLYMLLTGYFPANLVFSLRGYRLQRSAPDSSGILVRIAGGLWVIGATVKYLGDDNSGTFVLAVIAGVLGLICLLLSYFQ